MASKASWHNASIGLGGSEALKGLRASDALVTPVEVDSQQELQAFFDAAIAGGIATLSTLSTMKQDAADASADVKTRVESAIPNSNWERVTDEYVKMVELLADNFRAEKDSFGQA